MSGALSGESVEDHRTYFVRFRLIRDQLHAEQVAESSRAGSWRSSPAGGRPRAMWTVRAECSARRRGELRGAVPRRAVARVPRRQVSRVRRRAVARLSSACHGTIELAARRRAIRTGLVTVPTSRVTTSHESKLSIALKRWPTDRRAVGRYRFSAGAPVTRSAAAPGRAPGCRADAPRPPTASAAELWRMPGVIADQPELTVPWPMWVRLPGVRSHQSRYLPDGHQARHERFRVTSPAAHPGRPFRRRRSDSPRQTRRRQPPPSPPHSRRLARGLRRARQPRPEAAHGPAGGTRRPPPRLPPGRQPEGARRAADPRQRGAGRAPAPVPGRRRVDRLPPRLVVPRRPDRDRVQRIRLPPHPECDRPRRRPLRRPHGHRLAGPPGHVGDHGPDPCQPVRALRALAPSEV